MQKIAAWAEEMQDLECTTHKDGFVYWNGQVTKAGKSAWLACFTDCKMVQKRAEKAERWPGNNTLQQLLLLSGSQNLKCFMCT